MFTKLVRIGKDAELRSANGKPVLSVSVVYDVGWGQQLLDLFSVVLRRGLDQFGRQLQCATCFGFDRDMDKDEPVLVLTAKEILVHRDIVEADTVRLVEAIPVVEHIA